MRRLKTRQRLMRAIGVNDAANDGKHQIRNVHVSIEDVLDVYNKMIEELVTATGLTALNICHLKKKQDVREVAIFDEKKSVRYGQIANVKYQLRLSPDYKADPYAKKVETTLTVFWPEAYEHMFLNVTVNNNKNHKVLAAKQGIDLSKAGRWSLRISLHESDLDRRVLSVNVTIQLMKEQEQTTVTGHLFWKKEHSYTERKAVAQQVERQISQILRNERSSPTGQDVSPF